MNSLEELINRLKYCEKIMRDVLDLLDVQGEAAFADLISPRQANYVKCAIGDARERLEALNEELEVQE